MRKLLPVLLALPLFAGQAFAWGCDGHQMVALIARAHLTPAASAAVDKILSANPISPQHGRFCQDTPTDLMAVAAPWADDQKTIDKTFLWHQIDIPISVASGDYRTWCEPIGPSADGRDRPGCVVNALEYELQTLRAANTSDFERAKALAYLIHLMGDITQPLHDSDNDDQGGNCTSFELPFLEKPTTLHGIWDYDLITHELQEKKVTETQLAGMIDRESAAKWPEWGSVKFDPEAWAWEGQHVAVAATYGALQPRIPLAANTNGHTSREACNAGRARVAAMHIPIDQTYRDKTLGTIHQQIAKAGYRLAGLLNETYK